MHLEVTVVFISLVDFVVNARGGSSSSSTNLLLLDFLDPVNVRVFCLDPAPLVANDILVGQLGDGLDFFHRRVRQQRLSVRICDL